MVIKALFTKQKSLLAHLLGSKTNQEELLGMLAPEQPSPKKILTDANHIVNYSTKEDYKVWAQEAWAQVLAGLDKILDPATPLDKVNVYRGEVNAILNMLRISYKAREVKNALEREEEQKAAS